MLADRKKAIKRLISLQKQELASLYNTGYAPEWERFVLQLPEKKLSKPSQRAQFVYFMHEYLMEYAKKHKVGYSDEIINKDNIIKLAVLAELVIDVQYYENYIIDGKNGANSTEILVKYNNAAAHLKSITFNYISEHFSADLSIEKDIRNKVQLMFDMVNTGQQAEQCYNHYNSFIKGFDEVPNFGSAIEKRIDPVYIEQISNHFDSFLGLNEKDTIFLKTYLKRLNLTSVQLFKGFVELLIELLQIKDKELNKQALAFAEYFGYTVQLVNDNIDIVELATGSKIPEDAFSDLLNKNITLPLFIHLVKHRKGGIIHKILKSRDVLRHANYEVRKHDRIVRAIKEKYSKKVCRALRSDMLDVAIPFTASIAKKTEKHLDIELKSAKILINMCEIAYDNRFYDVIKNIEPSLSERFKGSLIFLKTLKKANKSSKNAQGATKNIEPVLN